MAGEIAETTRHIFEAVAHQLGDDLPSTIATLVRLGALISEARDAESAQVSIAFEALGAGEEAVGNTR